MVFFRWQDKKEKEGENEGEKTVIKRLPCKIERKVLGCWRYKKKAKIYKKKKGEL